VDLKETGWMGDEWIHLAQDRDQQQVLASTVNEHSGSINVVIFLIS
jgi:hypothetical protein